MPADDGLGPNNLKGRAVVAERLVAVRVVAEIGGADAGDGVGAGIGVGAAGVGSAVSVSAETGLLLDVAEGVEGVFEILNVPRLAESRRDDAISIHARTTVTAGGGT